MVFPLETHAEKDGTVTHPDGRLQRVRPSAGRPGDIRPNIQRPRRALPQNLGLDTGIDSQPTAFAALTEAVPFYAAIEDTDIGGRGIRWQDTPARRESPEPEGAGLGRRTLSAKRLPQLGGRTIARRVASADPGAGAPSPSAPTATSGPARSPSSTRR